MTDTNEEAITPVPLSKPKIKKFKIADLTKAKSNVRSEYPGEGMTLLRASIRTLGLLELPKANSKGEVFAGWGRVEAAKREGHTEMWLLIVDTLKPEEQILASLSENYARANLYDDEVRFALKRLVEEADMLPREIARKTGMNEGLVYSLLDFYKLPKLAQEMAKEVKPGIYATAKIKQIVDKVPEEDKEAVAIKMIEVTQEMPKGQRKKKKDRPIPTRPVPTLKEIADMAETGQDMKSKLQRILEEAKKVEYMTITVSVPEPIYMKYFKYSRLFKQTMHELIVAAMEKNMPTIDKGLESKGITP